MVVTNDRDLEEGDSVLVRMREDGQLVAKFVATVGGIEDKFAGSERIVLYTPWTEGGRFGGSPERFTLAPYEAEFEVLDDPDDVSF